LKITWGQIKQLLRKPNYPLEQIANRISEMKLIDNGPSLNEAPGGFTCRTRYTGGPLLDDTVGEQFKEAYSKNYCIKLDKSNGYFIVENEKSICKAVNIIKMNDDIIVLFKKFRYQSNFFFYPMPSSDVDIYKVKKLSNIIYQTSIEKIYCKCLVLPLLRTKYFTSIPMLHTQL